MTQPSSSRAFSLGFGRPWRDELEIFRDLLGVHSGRYTQIKRLQRPGEKNSREERKRPGHWHSATHWQRQRRMASKPEDDH